MDSRTVSRILCLLHAGADWFVNGYLLHPRRRRAVLGAMAGCLGALMLALTLGGGDVPAAAPALVCPAPAGEGVVQDREAYLMNRIWLDKLPQNDRDRLQLYLFQENNVGVHVVLESFYRFSFELFKFNVRNNRIEFVFPHTRQRVASDYTIVDHRGRGDLNLKLSLAADPRNGGQARDYYSHLENPKAVPAWIVESAREAIQRYGE